MVILHCIYVINTQPLFIEIENLPAVRCDKSKKVQIISQWGVWDAAVLEISFHCHY